MNFGPSGAPCGTALRGAGCVQPSATSTPMTGATARWFFSFFPPVGAPPPGARGQGGGGEGRGASSATSLLGKNKGVPPSGRPVGGVLSPGFFEFFLRPVS